jgi:hypothetical protein
MTEDASGGFTFKDWVTTILSCLALALSVATAYWTIARIEENVSVVIHGPQLAYRVSRDQLAVGGESSDLMFINSGNRPVGVLDVQVGFQTGDKPKSCETNGATRFITSFKPIIVKENEIVTTSIKIDSIESLNSPTPKGKTPPSKNVFNVDDASKKKNELDALSCLFVELSTPSTAFYAAAVPISSFHVVDSGVAFNPTENEGHPQPQLLFSRFGNIFHNAPETKATAPEQSKDTAKKS